MSVHIRLFVSINTAAPATRARAKGKACWQNHLTRTTAGDYENLDTYYAGVDVPKCCLYTVNALIEVTYMYEYFIVVVAKWLI